MSFKLLAVIPNPKDATSYYRAVGPLSLMEKDYDLTYTVMQQGDSLSWHEMMKYDAVFLQRPCLETHIQIVDLARKLKKPVWIDYDDNVFTIPIDNPSHNFYALKRTREIITILLGVANVVTVSTNALAKDLSQYSSKIVVCRNAYNDGLTSKFPNAKRNKVVCWRGTNTHERDVRLVMRQIIDVMNEYKDWNFVSLGTSWWFLAEELAGRYTFQATSSVIQYFSVLHEVGASVHIVPLVDNPFNHSKSNIAWQEATIVGSACVIPDFEEWKEAEAARYTSAEGFGESLRYLIKNEDERKEMSEKSRTILEDKFKLSLINEKRVKCLSLISDIEINKRDNRKPIRNDA